MTFYLKPDFSKINGDVVVGAMNQAFFSLSTGMGGMAIFGSYIGKDHSLMGEAINVISLDTLVALLAGRDLVVFLLLYLIYLFKCPAEEYGVRSASCLWCLRQCQPFWVFAKIFLQ